MALVGFRNALLRHEFFVRGSRAAGASTEEIAVAFGRY
jgi:hypothetical protein